MLRCIDIIIVFKHYLLLSAYRAQFYHSIYAYYRIWKSLHLHLTQLAGHDVIHLLASARTIPMKNASMHTLYLTPRCFHTRKVRNSSVCPSSSRRRLRFRLPLIQYKACDDFLSWLWVFSFMMMIIYIMHLFSLSNDAGEVRDYKIKVFEEFADMPLALPLIEPDEWHNSLKSAELIGRICRPHVNATYQ